MSLDKGKIIEGVTVGQKLMTFLTDNIADKSWCPAWLSLMLYRGRSWALWQKQSRPWE